MGAPLWISLFAADCLFCFRVLRWGGAEHVEGWRAVDWSVEGIKLHVTLR